MKCGFDNPDDAVFCVECGEAINNIPNNGEIKKNLSGPDKNYQNTSTQASADIKSDDKNKKGTASAGKKGMILAVVAVVIVILVVFVIFVIKKSESKNKRSTGETDNSTSYKTQSDNSTVSVYKTGDIITFGEYEQDNNIVDGKEDTEWIILEVQENRVLVILKYGLDAEAYNNSFVGTTWENCSLRNWLNNSFYNSAFSDSDKSKIQMTTIYNTDDYEYNVSGGEYLCSA